MGQQILPLFYEGENSINSKVYYEYDKDTGNVNYFLYCLPCYFHHIDEKNNFSDSPDIIRLGSGDIFAGGG